MAKKKGATTPTQYRLRDDTLAQLDAIVAHIAELTGNSTEPSRADAIRFAAKYVCDGLKLQPAASRKGK